MLRSLLQSRRFLRVRPQISQVASKLFSIDNPVTCQNWPPMKYVGNQISHQYCLQTMRQLSIDEELKMRESRTFTMPKIRLGDLVEVRYEITRSQQTFATFQGYCIHLKKKGLNASFVLKNTIDGVGVEQLFPFSSPRLLEVRVVKTMMTEDQIDRRPRTRNYRYRWQNYFRHHNSTQRADNQKSGLLSLELKIKKHQSILNHRRKMMRFEAKLPQYIWPGPYAITRRQNREVLAEQNRRMLVYAWDERRQRALKKQKLADRAKWGSYAASSPTRVTQRVKQELPKYHELKGNLPK